MIAVPPGVRVIPAVAVTILLGVLSAHAFVLSPILTISMLLVLHPLYFWSIYRPTLFPAWAAFLMGFFLDLGARTLLGLNAFLFVLVALMITRQRRYLLSQPFATQWAAFFLISIGVEFLRWLVMMLISWTVFSPASGLVSAVLSATLYPVTALVMHGCLRVISPHSTERSL